MTMLAYHEIILRLVVATVLGGMVGLERERLEWVAGLRTHMLVSVGAALVMIVSSFGFQDILTTPNVILDPSRVAAQVVSGIGFLGAGTILLLRHEVIRGLTTAASLWAVAAVGLAVGGGLYVAALATTALIVIILAVIKPIERRLFHRHRVRQIAVVVDRQRVSLFDVTAVLDEAALSVHETTLKRHDTPTTDLIQFSLARSVKKDRVVDLVAKLRAIEGVQGVTF